MLIRISLIIALIAALAVAALNFTQIREKITTLKTQRDEWQQKFTTTDAELTTTKDTLAKTETELNQTKSTLEATVTERDTAVKRADEEIRRAGELADKLAKTTDERDTAQAELERFVRTGYKPEQIIAFGKQVKQLQQEVEVTQDENRMLVRKNERLNYVIARYFGTNAPIELPPTATGKIMVSDPKWDFVVLSVGSDGGMRQDAELLVSRAGKLIAKIRVESVEKDRSIANVLPGWKLSDVLEGDQVIPAYPSAS
jgi:hypothetical protein